MSCKTKFSQKKNAKPFLCNFFQKLTTDVLKVEMSWKTYIYQNKDQKNLLKFKTVS